MRIFFFLSLCQIIASMTIPHKIKLGDSPFTSATKPPPSNPLKGCDQHLPDEEIDNILLQSIQDNFKRREIIATLQDDTISISHKLKIIEKYRHLIYFCEPIPNILAAGLLDDWEFDIL